MSIIAENNSGRDDIYSSNSVIEEYFQYDRYRTFRTFKNRQRYFGGEIGTTLDAEIMEAIKGMEVAQNESRLLWYLKSTSPDKIPLELRLFFSRCVSYYRSSNFCDAMVDNTERDIRDNNIVLIQDAQDVVYILKYGKNSDKIVVCVSDDGSVGLFDDWTMNLLLKYVSRSPTSLPMVDPAYEGLGELVGSRRKLKFDFSPTFSIARIQGQMKYTCFREVLKDLRKELHIPYRQRNRFTEEVTSI